jgi:hypothetical protein
VRPELRASDRSGSIVAAAICGGLALAMAWALPSEGIRVSMTNFWWIAIASIVACAWVVARAGLWTAAGAYAAVFWCFHFGLIAVLGSGIVRPTEISLWDQLWVLGPFAGDAALVALIGAVAFGAGVSLVQAWSEPAGTPPAAVRRQGAHPHGTAGAILVFGAVAVWCGIVVTTSGLTGFFSSYGDYLHATAEFSTLISGVWLALGCGFVLAVTGDRGWVRTGAIAVFVGFALVALPLGLRGEIMFPSIAAFVASARCGWKLSPARTCAFAVSLLLLIPAVREVRQMGLQGLPDMVLELRLFDAFAEMGGSLHPVEKVVRWRAEGEPLDMGSSYWAPIERAAARILPGLVTPAAEDDLRIMNVLVTERVGAIGFSPVAEAYRNFGATGVALVMALFGAAFARIDRLGDRRLAVLAIATVYLPLLTNVRNSFVSVPAQCALGVILVVGLTAMRHVSSTVLCRPDARSTYVRG